ncbi:MAG: alanine--glyoxylate aminotransferase family protein [Pseudomonadota bacterium]
MSQSGGRAYCAIPGPTVVPDEVLQAMHRAAPNIYSDEVMALTQGLIPDLKRVARTDGDAAIYICNGHGTWEAALANLVAPGERVLVPATGRFGHGWARMSEAMGIEVEVMDFGLETPMDADRIETVLKSDTDRKIKAVLVTHVDTSTSLRNDVKAISDAIHAADHPALLLADCIASMGCDRFEMDAWGADVAVTGSQKGLMTPPGAGFVFFNEKAAQTRAAMPRVSPYWDWAPRVHPEELYLYFAGTAPTHHLYGLRTALDMIHAEGMENVWARHELLARAVWAASEVWGQDGSLRLNVANPDHRSRAVTTVRLPAPDAARLRAWVEENTGVTLGLAIGMQRTDDPEGRGVFRIGHMGHVNAHMVLGVLGAIETGLSALNIAHGAGGVSAATQVLAQTQAAQTVKNVYSGAA